MSIFGKQKYCPSCMSPVKSATAVCKSCGYNPSQTPSSARYLKPGTVINERYLAGCVLSENSFSVTYMGMDLAEKKKKVIKEYCPFSCVSRINNEFEEITFKINAGKENIYKKGLEDYTAAFKKLRDIENEENGLDGVIRITNIVESFGTCYVVSDFAEGTTLKKLLKGKDKMPSDEVFALMKPVISSLITLHKNDIIHGNISPYNIIVSPDRKNVYLTGFGIYGYNEDAEEFSIIPKQGFAPLEQYTAFRGAVGPWTDIYSVCTTIYSALTGVVPDDAPDRTVNDEVERISDLGVTISEVKEDALMQGMEVYERDRFKAIRALYNAMYSEDEEIVYTAPEPEPVAEEAPVVEEAAPEAAVEEAPAPEVVPEAAPVSVPDPEPAPQAVPEPVKEIPLSKAESAPAPVNTSSDGYSQVIVRRRNKDRIEIGGEVYSAKLETLDLSGKGITDDDTENMELLVNLEYLTLDDNKIADIEFLDSLRKLVSFSAKNNYISDISVLVNLSYLRELYLGGNKELTDISVLENLRGIRKLDLSGTGITDVKPLIYLDHLKTLNLKNTAVTPKQIKMLYSEMPNCEIRYDAK
ncbi:MAG: protein kinase [Oscillospiraceae bacterium]|nr:protein kinase [Oscillospiraceae bacterium]